MDLRNWLLNRRQMYRPCALRERRVQFVASRLRGKCWFQCVRAATPRGLAATTAAPRPQRILETANSNARGDRAIAWALALLFSFFCFSARRYRPERVDRGAIKDAEAGVELISIISLTVVGDKTIQALPSDHRGCRLMMTHRIALSKESAKAGEYPYAAVVCRNGVIVAKFINQAGHLLFAFATSKNC